MHERQAYSRGKLSLDDTSLLPIFGQSPSPIYSTKLHRKNSCQEKSHEVYTLQDAYLGRTPTMYTTSECYGCLHLEMKFTKEQLRALENTQNVVSQSNEKLSFSLYSDDMWYCIHF